MNDELIDAFKRFFDNSNYVPDPTCLEGMTEYQQKIPLKCCPYTDPKKKELWEHGWAVTDIGHVKASQYDGEYEDPKNWPDPK